MSQAADGAVGEADPGDRLEDSRLETLAEGTSWGANAPTALT